MQQDWQERTRQLLGDDAVEQLRRARVLVFGLGGVGSYAVEALARAGVGTLGLVDKDCVQLSNCNRQLYALRSTIGERKTDVARRRIADIAPDTHVVVYPIFYLPETAGEIDFGQYDCVIDAIDTVTAKLDLVQQCARHGIAYIGVMGTGNKLDPTRLHAGDLNDTRVCPLARVMRRECKARGLERVQVIWSDEEPAQAGGVLSRIPASLVTVPASAGLLAASRALDAILHPASSVPVCRQVKS